LGIYLICCPECDNQHLWFSGNQSQLCEKCAWNEKAKKVIKIIQDMSKPKTIKLPKESKMAKAKAKTKKPKTKK
jgi:hypothetical protein